MATDYIPLDQTQLSEFYHAGFAAMNQGFCLLEKVETALAAPADFRYLLVNPAFEQQSGLQQVVGKTLRQIVPGIEEDIIAHYEGVALRGEPVQFEEHVAALNAWISAYVFVVRQQPPARIAILFTNVTQRKEAEAALIHRAQRQAFLLRLGDALRLVADPVVIQHTAVQLLGEHLGANQVHYGETVGEEVIIHQGYGKGLPPMVGRFHSVDFGKQLTATHAAGQVQVVDDIEQNPLATDAERQALRAAHIGAYITVPLIKEGQWVATLAVHSIAPRAWARQQVELVQDVAERTWAAVQQARAEAALRESEKHFRLTIEAARMGTWDWNLVTNEVVWNEEHFRLFGMPPQPNPVSPDQYFTHVHPDERERVGRLLQEAITNRGVFDTEFCAVLEDGSQRWMSGYGRVAEEVNGRATRMSGVMFDVDKRKRAEEGLRQADRRKDEFLALLAHELRNPLATLSNTLQLLEVTGGRHPSLTLAMAVTLMQREVVQLVRLVDDLLDVSRISQGKVLLSLERLELVSLVDQAVQAAQTQFTTANRTLSVALPTSPVYLAGDAVRLRQVVSNLLHNALKFTSPGGQVWLSLERQADQEALRIRDNGIGIPTHELARIFEMFAQVDTSLGRSQGGLGLGLTLVHELVGLHGGRVEASSPGLGQGSEFVVYLPLLTELKEELHLQDSPDSAKPAGHRLLVIDDNADAALTLSLLLEFKGYQVTTACSGQEGLQTAQALHPTVILCDISMPGMDGYETCRLIRAQPWGRSVVLVALTGYGQAEDKLRTKQAGFDAHLVKPVDITDLSKWLSELPVPS